MENYTNLKKAVENQRLSLSGVDPDEDDMNLVKYQEAYNLSAKMIQIMSEIYDKLINETGV
jgi:flagellar hook-associated protein 1 FlgK